MSSAEEILAQINKVEIEVKIFNQKRVEIVSHIQSLQSKLETLRARYNAMKTKEVSSIDWANNSYEWDAKVRQALRDKFKLDTFRSRQLAAINATLAKKDLILLMPTGGGKSLCYQLPAVVSPGVTIVISPLLSLIEDQVSALKRLGIEATAINSSTSKGDSKQIYDGMAKGPLKHKLIYVTPEWMAKSKRFMSYLQKCYVRGALDRFAIDEVHCLSQWGHDFRPDYKFLTVLKKAFSNIPIIGLTATATESIVSDVQSILGIPGCVILKTSYNRPNLFYQVLQKPATQEKCVALLYDLVTRKFKNQSGIVYTTTISDSVEVAKDLKCKGVRVACYHANLDAEVRQKIHVKWMENMYQILVATVAFGMGIDKPDVRFVIHHSLPKSMESFYQESGRAGRNNDRADCILLYCLKDVIRLSSMVASTPTGSSNLYNLVKYCLDARNCRRSIIATHFDAAWTESDCNKMCDRCLSPSFQNKEITQHCKNIIAVIEHANIMQNRLTVIKLLDAFFKTGPSKNLGPDHLQRPQITRIMAEYIIAFMLTEKYLKEVLSYTAYNTISYINIGPKNCDTRIFMDIPRYYASEAATSASTASAASSSSQKRPSKNGTSKAASGEKRKKTE